MITKKYVLLEHSYNNVPFYYGDLMPFEALGSDELYQRWFKVNKLNNINQITVQTIGNYALQENYVAKLNQCIDKSTSFIISCPQCLTRVLTVNDHRTCKQVVNMYNYQIYPSARALAAASGLKLETIYQRLKRFKARGIGTVEEAIYSVRFEFTDKVYPCYLDTYRGHLD